MYIRAILATSVQMDLATSTMQSAKVRSRRHPYRSCAPGRFCFLMTTALLRRFSFNHAKRMPRLGEGA
jgi:hypothetical protein